MAIFNSYVSHYQRVCHGQWPGDLQIVGSLPPLLPGCLPTAGPTAACAAAGGAAGDVQAAGDQGAVGWVLKWDMKPQIMAFS